MTGEVGLEQLYLPDEGVPVLAEYEYPVGVGPYRHRRSPSKQLLVLYLYTV